MHSRIRPAGTCAAICLALFFASGCSRDSQTQVRAAATAATRSAVAPAPLPKPPVAKYQRDLYGKLDDCVADWGFAGRCTPLSPDAPERARGATFFGPIYSNTLRFETQITTRREAVEQGYLGQLDETPSNKSIASTEIRS
jgi:hypothetical protein